MSRIFAALLSLGTLAMIGLYAYWTLQQGRMIPGLGRFFLTFSAILGLPYLVTLCLLATRDGRNGLRFAFGTALVNAIWVLPLGALSSIFIGFAMGNVDQQSKIFALATAGVLQVLLLVVAGGELRRTRPREPETVAADALTTGVWTLAFALPILASVASWAYFDQQQKALEARAALARSHDQAAQETVGMLRSCLATHRERGYPAKLDACPEAASRTGEGSGFRFEYLPALAGADGRIGAYFICAQPIGFRVTGYSTLVADASGTYGYGASALSPPDAPPTCASVLDVERAIAWCAYGRAAREPARGYPERLADIAPCVSEQRRLREIGPDRLTRDKEERYAYLAEAPDASGRIARYRIYRFGFGGEKPLWIDDQFRESKRETPKDGPIVEGLPAAAVPERFAPGCAQGRGADCFAAGTEWQRKAHQTGGAEREVLIAPMREAALKAFARGCELKDARSCTWLGIEFERAGPELDVVRAAALYEKACALGYGPGCLNAARMYEGGRKARALSVQPPPVAAPKPDLPRDVPRAVALYSRACDLDQREACFSAARLLAAGEGVEPDREKAFAIYARLCEDGLALACARAAGLSTERQKEYLHRACVFGEAGACAAR